MRIGWIAIGGVAVVTLYAIFAFNRLIRGRNLVREGFSGIDVQLRRRNDLIPSLVEVVKGYAGHERSLFEEIAARRAIAPTDRSGEGELTAPRLIPGDNTVAPSAPSPPPASMDDRLAIDPLRDVGIVASTASMVWTTLLAFASR